MSVEEVLRGNGVGHSITFAPAWRVKRRPRVPIDEVRGPAPEAVARFESAAIAVAKDLQTLAESHSGTTQGVLLAAAQMARDPVLFRRVTEQIERGLGPATAVDRVIGDLAREFTAAGGLLAERVPDLHSVRDRVITHLLGEPAQNIELPREPVILVAEDLAPADTAEMDFANVAGVITAAGGPLSHISIIAQELDIPALTGAVGAELLTSGTPLALNAAAGIAYVNPAPTTVAALQTQETQLKELFTADFHPQLADGQRVELLANIGAPSQCSAAVTAGLAGVGLFRTEFLFLSRSEAPKVSEQAEIYAQVLAKFPSRKVVFRTLDAGSDKPVRFLDLPNEANPALGMRGARLYQRNSRILDEQLEAISQAQKIMDGVAWVMAPMIATAQEAQEFAARARSHGLQNIGVMIETPAAALEVDAVLAVVDFVSIGTNDLAQYTFAADRLRPELAHLLDPWQPALLQLLAKICAAGKTAAKPVGVCGQAAADPAFAAVLIGLGATSLSMAAGASPAVKYVLQDHTQEECKKLAQVALAQTDATAARYAVRNRLNQASRALLGH